MVNEREPGAPKQQDNRRYHTPSPVRCLWVTLSIRLSRRLFLTTMCKPDVTHKPEVQNISQHRQWMTKSRPQVTCTKTWWRSDAQLQRYAGGPTNRQTDRQTGAVITTPRSAIGGGVRMLGRYAPRCVAATSRVADTHVQMRWDEMTSERHSRCRCECPRSRRGGQTEGGGDPRDIGARSPHLSLPARRRRRKSINTRSA